MKYITKYKSPNYNSRKNSKIKLIIIHYTALKNATDAVSYLCDKDNRVSSHYLISQDGSVYNLLDDKFRAWHAGHAYWDGKIDINSISIGIELDYNPYGNNKKFSFKMLSSLKKLIIKIKNKYHISKKNILAHSDVSPFRKRDPGKHFPWKSLASSNIVPSNKRLKKNEIKIIEGWFHRNNYKIKKQKIILALSLIGYDTRKVYNNNKLYNKLIKAYKIRYCTGNSFKKNRPIYKILIQHLFNFMLTKE